MLYNLNTPDKHYSGLPSKIQHTMMNVVDADHIYKYFDKTILFFLWEIIEERHKQGIQYLKYIY